MNKKYSLLLRGFLFIGLGIALLYSGIERSSLPPLLHRAVASAMVIFGLVRIIQAFRKTNA